MAVGPFAFGCQVIYLFMDVPEVLIVARSLTVTMLLNQLQRKFSVLVMENPILDQESD